MFFFFLSQLIKKIYRLVDGGLLGENKTLRLPIKGSRHRMRYLNTFFSEIQIRNIGI